ncbi:MAG: glycerate kinase [Dehalococcoidia bacterium]|nr:glycerate kinase [Dehalococcoidia bacterium]
MRILVCPQEFKGSLTVHEATAAIAAGLRRALPDSEVIEAPMADGGPGTLEVLRAARHGQLVTGSYLGAMGEPVEAAFALLPAGDGAPVTAVIEAAATIGLSLVPPQQRDPGDATSYGVGEQIAEALRRGARRIIVGSGGTATNDGGAGAVQALGLRLLDGRGHDLPHGPLGLHWLSRIDASGVAAGLAETQVVIAADVTNPLLGLEGATTVFGPQKGVTFAHAHRIEGALKHWAKICSRDLGVDVAGLEGGGAGGGLAAGLAAACHASIGSGASVVAEAIGLRALIEGCDVVITGEGQIDPQTSRGKTVAYVAALAGELGKPCYAVAGRVIERLDGLADVEESGASFTQDEAISRGALLVEAAAERLARRLP